MEKDCNYCKFAVDTPNSMVCTAEKFLRIKRNNFMTGEEYFTIGESFYRYPTQFTECRIVRQKAPDCSQYEKA